MPASSGPPAPPPVPDRSRRVYVWWGVGFAFLAALGAFCWLVWPQLRARAEVRRLTPLYYFAEIEPTCWPTVRSQAGAAIRRLGGERRAAETLAIYVGLPKRVAPDKQVALLVMSCCGRPAVPALARLLHGRDVRVREAAARALGTIGSEAWEAVPALAVALADPGEAVRLRAARALGHIGPAAGSAAPQLVEMLGREDRNERLAAATALEAIGPAAGCAIPALQATLNDPDWEVCKAAAGALANIRGGTHAGR